MKTLLRAIVYVVAACLGGAIGLIILGGLWPALYSCKLVLQKGGAIREIDPESIRLAQQDSAWAFINKCQILGSTYDLRATENMAITLLIIGGSAFIVFAIARKVVKTVSR